MLLPGLLSPSHFFVAYVKAYIDRRRKFKHVCRNIFFMMMFLFGACLFLFEMFSVNFEKMKLFLFLVVVGLGNGCKMKDPCEKCVSHCTFVEFHDGKSLCLMSAIGISGVRFLIPPGGEGMCSSEENDSVEATPHEMESENARTQEESGKEENAHSQGIDGVWEGAHPQGMDRVGGTLEGAHFPKKAGSHSQGIGGAEGTGESAHPPGTDRVGGTSEGAHFPKKAGARSPGMDRAGGISESAHLSGIDRVVGTLEGAHFHGMDRSGGISEGAHLPKKARETLEGAHLSGMDRAGDEKSERQEETGQKSFEGRNETNQKIDEGGFPLWGFLFIGIVSFCLILVVFSLVLNVLKNKYHRHRDDCYDHL